MKKLLLGALCIMASCQSKPIPQKQKTVPSVFRVHENTHQKQDSIAIKTTVKVVDYHKKLFKVYTLAGHFYAGRGSGLFSTAESQEQIDRYLNGYCDTIKLIVSKPLPIKGLYTVKKAQYKLCERAINEVYFNKHRKDILDKIAEKESNNIDSSTWNGYRYVDETGDHYSYEKFGKY